MPRRAAARSKACGELVAPCHAALNFVVTKISSRGTPLTRIASPTASSLPYCSDVSSSRYPASSASRTARVAGSPRSGHVPSPSWGISAPPRSRSAGALTQAARPPSRRGSRR